MTMVTIGPKYYRSTLPVGKVELETTFQNIALADQGKLGKQYYNFNLQVGKVKKISNYMTEANYLRAYVINGHCRYKRYTLFDKVAYRFFQLFGQRSKNGVTQSRG